MLSLLCPIVGKPFFEEIPEKHRGMSVSISVREKNINPHYLYGSGERWFRVDFTWRTQLCRKDGSVMFDVFEETE